MPTSHRASALVISLNYKKHIFHQRKHQWILLLFRVMTGKQNMQTTHVLSKVTSLVINSLIENKKQATFMKQH